MDTLQEVIKNLTKKFNGSIITNGQKEKVRSISTGSYILDSKTGISGYPLGKLIEISGGEAAGKTTLAIAAVKSFQEKDKQRKCVFVDMEHTFDNEFAESMGIKTKDLIIVNPMSGEEAFDTVNDLLETGGISLIVIDSVAAMVSISEMEDSIGDAKIGMLGRLMSKGLKKTIPLADKHKTTILLLNQLREKIGGWKASYGETRESTGGNALKFYASMRIQVSKGKAFINQKNEIIGHQMRFKVVKNKAGLPYKEGEIPILYGRGVSTIDELITIAISLGVIIIAGSWYQYVVTEEDKQNIGQGMEAVRKYFQTNEPAMKILHSACKQELERLKKERFNIDYESYREKA